MSNYFQRVEASSCKHPYCISQSIETGPDFSTLETNKNFGCLSDLKNKNPGDCIDRHLEEFKISDALEHPRLLFNIIIDSSMDDWEKMKLLSQKNNIIFTIHMDKDCEFPKELLRAHFFFPLDTWDPTLVESFSARNHQCEILPPLTGRIFETRWSDFEDRSPQPSVIDIKNQSKRLLSIVIPVYNHNKELNLTLKTLSKQSIDKNLFEVLIIDDGSDDSCKSIYDDLSIENKSFYYLPRPSSRSMGDNKCRVTVARNFGALKANGEIILFLDADTLLTNDFLSNLLKSHENFDVVQPRRLHLNEQATNALYRGETLEKVTEQVYSRSNNYFEDFQNKTKNWNDIPFGWRYASTFCFSVKKKFFEKTGGFSKSFCFYSFEDVELGYRLFLAGNKFHLLADNVYALFHEKNRSEYMNDSDKKINLHRKSAQLFYHQNLDSNIYEAMKFYFT